MGCYEHVDLPSQILFITVFIFYMKEFRERSWNLWWRTGAQAIVQAYCIIMWVKAREEVGTRRVLFSFQLFDFDFYFIFILFNMG